MRKDKGRKRIIVIGVLIMSLIVLMTIGYCLFKAIETTNVHKKIGIVSDIALQAQSLGIENVHTQLKIWEYAHYPSPERLSAFQQHNQELNERMNKLIMLTETSDGFLYYGAEKDVKKFREDFVKIQEDWEELLEIISEFQRVKEMNISQEELNNANAKISQRVIKNEELFDSFEFNRQIDSSIKKQIEELKRNRELIGSLHHSIKIALLFLTAFYVMLLIFIAIWLSTMLKKR